MFPKQLIAGDTWSWRSNYADYPAGVWTASVHLLSKDGAYSAAATADGTTHVFSVDAATSAGYVAGRYSWTIRVTDGTTVKTVESGSVEVLPNPASTTKRDTRSWAVRTLEAVECFLAGNATTAQSSMTIGGRSISRWSLAELTQWREQLKLEVRSEERAGGSGRIIKVRLNRA